MIFSNGTNGKAQVVVSILQPPGISEVSGSDTEEVLRGVNDTWSRQILVSEVVSEEANATFVNEPTESSGNVQPANTGRDPFASDSRLENIVIDGALSVEDDSESDSDRGSYGESVYSDTPSMISSTSLLFLE